MKLRTIILSAAVAMLASCSAPKDIVYFQDVQRGSEFVSNNSAKIKIQPKDQLRIIVSTSDNRLTEQFNLSAGSLILPLLVPGGQGYRLHGRSGRRHRVPGAR